MDEYYRALDHGLRTIPAARQFVELFPQALSGITHYTSTSGTSQLYCRTALHNRYELKLVIPIEFDKSRTQVTAHEKPAFHLIELSSIALNDGSAASIKPGHLQRHFGGAEWTRLYEARGDFSAVGIELVRNQPVPNFDAYWQHEKSLEERPSEEQFLQKTAKVFAEAEESASRYRGALKSGVTTIPVVRQFRELFADNVAQFSDFDGKAPYLILDTPLRSRYVLVMALGVRLDEKRTKVIAWAGPSFYFIEYSRVTPYKSFHEELGKLEGFDAESSEPRWRFGKEKWEKLYQAGGDFSVIGIELIRDQPVPNFQAYWQDRKSKM